jgi:hypothetical protein
MRIVVRPSWLALEVVCSTWQRALEYCGLLAPGWESCVLVGDEDFCLLCFCKGRGSVSLSEEGER